jgi:hypothetical protein
MSPCVRAVDTHPKSAKCRVDRWRTLAMWDLRRLDGLVSSMVCLELYDDAAADG